MSSEQKDRITVRITTDNKSGTATLTVTEQRYIRLRAREITQTTAYPSIESLMREISREAKLESAQMLTGAIVGCGGALWAFLSGEPSFGILGTAIFVGGVSFALNRLPQVNRLSIIGKEVKRHCSPISKN